MPDDNIQNVWLTFRVTSWSTLYFLVPFLLIYTLCRMTVLLHRIWFQCFISLDSKRNFFRSLASKGFPDGYSTGGCVCMRVCPLSLRSSEPTRWFSQMMPDEHPRRHHLADGPLSSLYAPSPSFSSIGAASVMMCCSARAANGFFNPSLLYLHGVCVLHIKPFFVLVDIQHTLCPRWFFILEIYY